MRFRGLLAPGSDRLSGEEDLVAVWRTTRGQRFQNYRARFTVLDTQAIPRSWIDQLIAGEPLGSSYDFEQFAAGLWRMSQPNVDRIDVTRPWRDGGRDAVGDYLLGPRSDPVAVEFALEAKCYGQANGVGVRETSRLISRQRHPVEDRRARSAIPRSMSFCDTCVAQRYSNGPTGRRRLTGAEAFELEGMDSCYIDIDGFGPKDADTKGPESAPIAN